MSSGKTRYLIVEDDPQLNTALARYLHNSAIVDQATNLAGAFQFLAEREKGYDVVVLDRTLPDGDGLELIPFLRQDFPDTTICILSGLAREQDQCSGLKEGADLYLCKPLTARTVKEHIQAARKPHESAGAKALAWKDLILFTQLNRIQRAQSQVTLTRRETQFLSSFLQSDRGVATHDQLIQHFWPRSTHISAGAVHVTIQRLRKKLTQLGITIKVQYGAGYQLSYLNI